jgi:hypothetical protein
MVDLRLYLLDLKHSVAIYHLKIVELLCKRLIDDNQLRHNVKARRFVVSVENDGYSMPTSTLVLR